MRELQGVTLIASVCIRRTVSTSVIHNCNRYLLRSTGWITPERMDAHVGVVVVPSWRHLQLATSKSTNVNASMTSTELLLNRETLILNGPAPARFTGIGAVVVLLALDGDVAFPRVGENVIWMHPIFR